MRAIVVSITLLICGCLPPQPPEKPYKISIVAIDGRVVESVVRMSRRAPHIGSSEGLMMAWVYSNEPNVYAPAGCFIRVERLAEEE